MPRVSQPGARAARHKSQKRGGGAVTLAGVSWQAVGRRNPPLSGTIHLPGSGLDLLHILGFIALPCSPGGCFYSHFPAPSIEVPCPGSQRWVCGAGHSPCLQSSFLWESGPLGAVPTWHPAPPASCDPPSPGHCQLCCYPALLPACSASWLPADPARPLQCRCLV